MTCYIDCPLMLTLFQQLKTHSVFFIHIDLNCQSLRSCILWILWARLWSVNVVDMCGMNLLSFSKVVFFFGGPLSMCLRLAHLIKATHFCKQTIRYSITYIYLHTYRRMIKQTYHMWYTEHGQKLNMTSYHDYCMNYNTEFTKITE